MSVEPVPGEPAAVADCAAGRVLVVADVHCGIEVGLRREGVELASDADRRRDRLLDYIDRTAPDRLLVLGDLGHAIGPPSDEEREEIEALLSAATDRVPVTIVPGNHDGGIESITDGLDGVTLAPGHGTRLGDVGFSHGHTWPSPDVLTADVLCTAHEHPLVRLKDTVGGGRTERVWLRGALVSEPFEAFHETTLPVPDELVVFPAFNDRSGGTRINIGERAFLSPFLPDALVNGQAYLLDGTRLGAYERA